MTMQSYGTSIVIDCDFCGNHDEYEENEWDSALKYFKKLGWRNFKQQDEWKSKCGACYDR